MLDVIRHQVRAHRLTAKVAEKVGDLSAMVGGVVDDMPHRRRELLLSMGKRI
jgi:hypothetical protein